MPTALIILAAGQGTRMRSDRPKVLHQVAGAPLVHHAMNGAAALAPERTIVVAGHGAEAVETAVAALDPAAVTVRQDRQLGTAHAVQQAMPALAGFDGDVVVLYGDTPFIRPETLTRMTEARRAGHAVVVLGFEAAEPGRYGRLVMEGERLSRIAEAKDASPEELAITLCNSGVICADRAVLDVLLSAVGNDNASGEYYLTDIVEIANKTGHRCTAITCDEAETMGVNTRADLAAAEAVFQARARAAAMEAGVTLTDPASVHFAHDTRIGRDTVIAPNVVFGPGVEIGERVEIRAFCHLEGCRVAPGAQIGPFARLRPGANLAEDVHVGNFVEVKNASLAAGAKANHLSYIGDAEIGAATNVGAGTITCNYDGVMKHRTVIGRNAFIGSDTMLVAPVRVGDEAMTASGSVITQDVPDGALAVARGAQVNKPGLARRLMERLRAAKAARTR